MSSEAIIQSAGLYASHGSQSIVRSSAQSRMVSLDASRALAALAICWCHTAGNFDLHDHSELLGTFGVPFYLFAAMLFGVRGFARNPDRSVIAYIQDRFLKLYIPFLVWDIFYYILRSAKQSAGLSARDPEVLINHLWAGVQEHLYFLPLLMVVTIVMAILVKPSLHSTFVRCVIVVLFTIGAIILSATPTPSWMSSMTTADHAIWQYWRAAPAALLAIAFALVAARNGSIPRVSIWAGLIGLSILIACIAIQWGYQSDRTLRILSGIGFLMFALAPWQGVVVTKLAVVGRLSMGIYLMHVAVIRTLDVVVTRAHIAPTLGVKIMICLMAFTIALVVTWLMSRSRFTAWLIGQ